MVASAARPVRVATESRWERAFARAAGYGIAPRKLSCDRWAVQSAHKRPVLYMVSASPDGLSCTCMAAAEGDPICWHRAAVMAIAAETQPDPPTGGPAIGRYVVAVAIPGRTPSRVVRFGAETEVAEWAEMLARRVASDYRVERSTVAVEIAADFAA